jgi:hypothetical protein
MTEHHSGLKLLISYNIRADDAQAYYEFVLGRYVPVMQAMGLEMSEAWSTAFGAHPNRLIGFISRDPGKMYAALGDETWSALNDELQDYVTDFTYKVIPYALGFQF